MGSIFGRQPVAITAAFGALLNLILLLLPTVAPTLVLPDGFAAAANIAFAALVALVANTSVTPTSDPRLANGSAVNIENGVPQSIVVSQASVADLTVEQITDGGPA